MLRSPNDVRRELGFPPIEHAYEVPLGARRRSLARRLCDRYLRPIIVRSWR